MRDAKSRLHDKRGLLPESLRGHDLRCCWCETVRILSAWVSLCVLWAMLILWAGMKLWIWIKNLEWVGGIGAKGKGGMCGLGAFMPFFFFL